MTIEKLHGKAQEDYATKEPLAGDDASGEVADAELEAVSGGWCVAHCSAEGCGVPFMR